MRPLSIVLGLLFVTASLELVVPARAAETGIDIISVGHEGFLLRSGNLTVLLDSFLGPSETERDTLVRGAVVAMLGGQPPFDRVDVALISHPHQDHFNAMVAGEYLEKHREMVCATTGDVHSALQKEFPRYGAIKGRLVDVKWGPDGRLTKMLNGVRVDFVRSAHEASQFYPEAVALHIVHINGLNVMHGADAEMLTDQLSSLHLENEGLDVAILPYSFLASPGAAERFAEHVAAKQVVAMHLPTAEIEQAKEVIRKQFPNAIFLVTPLEDVHF
jgi:L-ascorbate metabolism protein UlaG (beta-lactamase superfamily)